MRIRGWAKWLAWRIGVAVGGVLVGWVPKIVKSVAEDRFDNWANSWLDERGAPKMVATAITWLADNPVYLTLAIPLVVIAVTVVQSHRRSRAPLPADPQPPAEIPSDLPRVYISQTPRDLIKLYERRTAHQGELLAEPLIGKWMRRLTGEVRDVIPVDVGSWTVCIRWGDKPTVPVYLRFPPERADRVTHLSRGGQITATGRIAEVNSFGYVTLEDCEIVDGDQESRLAAAAPQTSVLAAPSASSTSDHRVELERALGGVLGEINRNRAIRQPRLFDRTVSAVAPEHRYLDDALEKGGHFPLAVHAPALKEALIRLRRATDELSPSRLKSSPTAPFHNPYGEAANAAERLIVAFLSGGSPTAAGATTPSEPACGLSPSALELLEAVTERGEMWILTYRLLERPAVCIPDGDRGMTFFEGAMWFVSVQNWAVRSKYLDALEELCTAGLLREDTNAKRQSGRYFSLTGAGWKLLKEQAADENADLLRGVRALSREEESLLRRIEVHRSGREQLILMRKHGDIAKTNPKYTEATVERLAQEVAFEDKSVQMSEEAILEFLKGMPQEYLEQQNMPIMLPSGYLLMTLAVSATTLGRRFLRNSTIIGAYP